MDQATKLEPFLLLAKSAKGRAAADLVQKVTEEPGIFVFGELVDMPGMKEVSPVPLMRLPGPRSSRSRIPLNCFGLQLDGTDLAAAYRLLQLFCYGTWTEYKGTLDNIALEFAVTKLRLLR